MKVFVGSTFEDLESHREVLRLAIEKSKHHFVGMEHFVSSTGPSIDLCFRELKVCDVYVGLIGDYYGSSPPGRRLSFTELEYDYARANGIQQIMLVNGGAGYATHRPRQTRLNQQRIRRFKVKIKKHHNVQSFVDPGDAAWKVLASLIVYEASLQAPIVKPANQP